MDVPLGPNFEAPTVPDVLYTIRCYSIVYWFRFRLGLCVCAFKVHPEFGDWVATVVGLFEVIASVRNGTLKRRLGLP